MTTFVDRSEEMAALHAELFGEETPQDRPRPIRPPLGLDDKEVIDRMFRAANGARVQALFNGRIAAYSDDESRADFALVSHLAWWSGGDAAQIDRIFRQSALYREKWERQDYRDRTINKVLDTMTSYYSATTANANGNGHTNRDSHDDDPVQGATGSSKEDGPLNSIAGLKLIRMFDVKREEVVWRWSGRLPKGKLVIIEGDPGTAKSWLSMAIATAYTLGNPLPGDTEEWEPRNVIIFTAEDGLGDTVRPRLENMGADLARVVAVDAVIDADGAERFPNLADDLLFIGAELERGGYGLVIFDPLNAYLKGVDGNRDIDLRSVLGPLSALAERHRVTIICIRHLTKGNRDRAIYRGQGNIAYVAAARVVMLVGVNPDDDTERVVVPIKKNLAPLASPVAYEVTDGEFRWRGETDVTAEQMLAPDAQPEERGAREEATDFLEEALADGPRHASEVFRQAHSLGIADKTLKRAKSDLKVISKPFYEDGKRGAAGWQWSLPAGRQDLEGQESHYRNDGPLNESESEEHLSENQSGPLKARRS